MAKNLFSVPIFFIVFRETLEAAIIVSVLLGLSKQIAEADPGIVPVGPQSDTNDSRDDASKVESDVAATTASSEDGPVQRQRLIRKLRWLILGGAGVGLLAAITIGAIFIALWFTKAKDLWAVSEEAWEGSFELVACLMIFVMGVTMLKMDRAKVKWRLKLLKDFEGKTTGGAAKASKWTLFTLPLITVLREGLEAVIFVGGVSLGQPATSIPIAAIVGLICGFACGFLIYAFASRTTLSVFLIVMTNFLLLIGAGLFSKAVGAFQENAYNHLLGMDVDDAGGDGPGSYLVQGNVWHLDCCNPDSKLDGMGWSIFGAIFGWTNNATVGSILAYVFYWLAVIVVLVFMKFKEGRTKILGRQSAAGTRRAARRENVVDHKEEVPVDNNGGDLLPR
ncbi:Ftr1 protein [Crucibulum laeve]|uniref:Ftr1 protein n=1 Tax=Crucibulum laeve TaxID=68775 RepID=A0A5C3MAJ7_9AGAR|nr:Ftr1 protein [Crucibulum laeve]